MIKKVKKLQNNTLQQFIDKLIEELKNENDNRLYHKEKELNIPFIISSLYQSFKNDNQNTYKDFISDLKMYPHYDISFNEPIDDLYSIIDADISFSFNLNTDQDIPYYSYRICFSYDERLYGYCECTPDMPDYREDKGCCGHGCDASFCQFTLYKIQTITNDEWHGDEHDYWEFEDEFYMNDKELAEKREQENKKREIQELKNRISSDSKELAELTSDFPGNIDEELDKYKKVLEFMKSIGL